MDSAVPWQVFDQVFTCAVYEPFQVQHTNQEACLIKFVWRRGKFFSDILARRRTSPRSNLRPARSNCLSLRSSCRQHAPTRPRAFPCLASSVDRVGSVQNNPAPIGAATAHVAHSSPPICHRQPPRHSRRHQPFWWNPMPVSSIGIAHLSSSSSWSSQQSSASAP